MGRSWRSLASRVGLVVAALLLIVAAVFAVLGRNFFRAAAFADRTAETLDDPAVAEYVADNITNAIIAQKPDLVGARPMILMSVTGIVRTRPFRAMARTAAWKAHQAIFSESGRGVVLSLPDLDVILRGALAQGSPELAAKLPPNLSARIAELGSSGTGEFVVRMWRLGLRLRVFSLLSIILAPALLVASIWVAPARQRALVQAGIAVGVAGFVILTILPATRIFVASRVDNALIQHALDGAMRTYLGPLRLWGIFFAGLGVLLAAASSAVLETVGAGTVARRVTGFLTHTPATRGAAIARGAALFVTGVLLVALPSLMLHGALILLGTFVALLGTRELFRLLLASMPVVPAATAKAASRRQALRTALVLGVAVIPAVIWVVVRNPERVPAVTTIDKCNGHPELCDRRVDQVVFPASHNSMSNTGISDWMFPHHMKAIPDQLKDGIRVLLVDVHRGFSGAARIKTDMEGERVSQERILEALGVEGSAAAIRIRERLVGEDTHHPGLYLCHGYCELGAYEFVPVLRAVREFLIENPEEVLILVLEDYVTTPELVQAFDESGLMELVYTGPSDPWPTLRELIGLGSRLIVFKESPAPGPAWLRPTIGNIQETPYTFYTAAEFSCVPNRGGTTGALYQMNHWIQTTPAPKPANAELVNAKDVLLRRARQFEKERGHVPNIVAVDFYTIGDLFAVVDSLNGVPAAIP